MTNENSYLYFDGTQTYIEIPSHPDFSVTTTGQLTISAWIRPETLIFPKVEGTHGGRYVHWLGKGERGAFSGHFACTVKTPPMAGETALVFCLQPRRGPRSGQYDRPLL